MKKFFSGLLLLIMVFLLASCGKDSATISAGGIELKQITALNDICSFKDDSYSVSSVKKLTSISGAYSTVRNHLLCTTETVNEIPTTRIYNTKSGELIGSYPSADVAFLTDYYYRFDLFFVKEDEMFSVYNILGDKINTVELSASLSPSDVYTDSFIVADQFYTVEDDVVTCGNLSYSTILGYDYLYKDYYYSIDNAAVLIEKEGKEPVSYTIPDYSSDSSVEVLANGDVLIQYTYEVTEKDSYVYWDPDTVKYYQLITLKLSPSGETKKLDFPYLMDSIMNTVNSPEIWERMGIKVDNVISGRTIENKLRGGYFSATMTNGCKIGNALSTENTTLKIMNQNRVLIDISGSEYLYSAKGKLIGSVSFYDWTSTKYMVAGDNIYDWDLKVLASAEGYKLMGRVGENFYYTKVNEEDKTELYIFNGSFLKISDEFTSCRPFSTYNLLEVVTTEGYEYYNEDGTKLFTTDNTMYFFSSGDDSVYGYALTEDGKTEYYQITYSNPQFYYAT